MLLSRGRPWPPGRVRFSGGPECANGAWRAAGAIVKRNPATWGAGRGGEGRGGRMRHHAGRGGHAELRSSRGRAVPVRAPDEARVESGSAAAASGGPCAHAGQSPRWVRIFPVCRRHRQVDDLRLFDVGDNPCGSGATGAQEEVRLVDLLDQASSRAHPSDGLRRASPRRRRLYYVPR